MDEVIMEVLTEQNAKTMAMQQAQQYGHDMRPWRRMRSAHHNSVSTCRKCGREMRVISTIIEQQEAERWKENGVIIGQFQGGLPNVDYTYVSSYLATPCSGR
jgi:hypothetical protein